MNYIEVYQTDARNLPTAITYAHNLLNPPQLRPLAHPVIQGRNISGAASIVSSAFRNDGCRGRWRPAGPESLAESQPARRSEAAGKMPA
jgi:hypothetical protein